MNSMSRRTFLAGSGGLAAAGMLSGCGTPVATNLTGGQPATADVIFWHLFGGGDGENLTRMVQAVEAADRMSVEATLLSWGNPYYTKLALSASSRRPPDVGITHLSRLPLLARAGLLAPVAEEGTEAAGITQDKFTPAAWKRATVNGTAYAVPLDTHPFVLFYNVDLARKAGLLKPGGEDLKPIEGREDFLAALRAMKQAGGRYGAVMSITADPSTTWRWFMTLYSGLAGPILTDQGTRVAIDTGAAEETFAFMQSLTGAERLMPGNATSTTTSTLFGQGNVGFLFEGEWQIPTYRGVSLPNGEPLNFTVVPFPAILGDKAVAYADSHALVIPRSPGRSAERTANSVRFIKGLLDNSSTWAAGGHIPAWLPVQESGEFREQEPQSNYVQAAFDAVYDPESWYTGAGSDFQTRVGAVITNVLTGATNPRDAVGAMTATLQRFATARPPVQ